MSFTAETCTSLVGSALIIHDFWKYCLHTIPYQRGIDLSEGYVMALYNSVPMMVLVGKNMSRLEHLLRDARELLAKRQLRKMTITLVSDQEHKERWVFVVKFTKLRDACNKSYHSIREEVRKVIGNILCTVIKSRSFQNAREVHLDFSETSRIVEEDIREFVSMDNFNTGFATVYTYLALN